MTKKLEYSQIQEQELVQQPIQVMEVRHLEQVPQLIPTAEQQLVVALIREMELPLQVVQQQGQVILQLETDLQQEVVHKVTNIF